MPLYVGRAASAIFAILSLGRGRGDKVLLPANICPAAVFPVCYAGYVPVFCDVDPVSGNVTTEAVQSSLRDDVGYAILPHMFGNPIDSFSSIVDCLHEKGVLVIEDCASAMGAFLEDGRQTGELGDYAVYSFGYSKTLDLGFGGSLTTKMGDESELEIVINQMPFVNEESQRREALLSRLYRIVLNERKVTEFESSLFLAAMAASKDIFLCKLKADQVDEIIQAETRLDDVVDARRKETRLYNSVFRKRNVPVNMYPFNSGSVPWRFCFTVPHGRRQTIIDSMLKAGVPVSDWYPCIANLFGDSYEYPAASSFGGSILNLPLLKGEEEVERIASKACDVLEKTIGNGDGSE